jgi:hypothetical protein
MNCRSIELGSKNDPSFPHYVGILSIILQQNLNAYFSNLLS